MGAKARGLLCFAAASRVTPTSPIELLSGGSVELPLFIVESYRLVPCGRSTSLRRWDLMVGYKHPSTFDARTRLIIFQGERWPQPLASRRAHDDRSRGSAVYDPEWSWTSPASASVRLVDRETAAGWLSQRPMLVLARRADRHRRSQRELARDCAFLPERISTTLPLGDKRFIWLPDRISCRAKGRDKGRVSL